MFKSITFNYNTVVENKVLHHLVDDDFTTFIKTRSRDPLPIMEQIILEYHRRNQKVAPNIVRACFFMKNMNVKQLLEDMLFYMDRYQPHISYGTKYHPCVLRQYKQLTFGKSK